MENEKVDLSEIVKIIGFLPYDELEKFTIELCKFDPVNAEFMREIITNEWGW